MNVFTMIILGVAWFFIIFGVVSIFAFKNMYMRIMASATIDTVASFLVLLALIFISPSVGFVLRFIMLVGFMLITGPISTHVNIRSAYLSKVPLEQLRKGK
ncbi:MAG TPA: monovalent cation/H(+) antiporter subunit G [Bacilli bacterium]|nr:monovalent cation/H(+) antiporter subunit G [Bacilli bacterium]